ncbi:PTS transporter subunit EIIC [Spiroplasma taiwanense]|uniref:PTS transporter subunit EIIC n=1 Tax=Spiroplasma taiwanense TaxID=2145 RepID=UPI00040E7C85|nr:PTS transporter subunit EIIC [Spiroplasma taiwanense]
MIKEKRKVENLFKKFGQKGINLAQKISQNKFVASIMESFILVMPIIIASTLFILIAELPISFGYKPSADSWYNDFKAFCLRLYNLSYGLLGACLCIAISSRMSEKINSKLEASKKMNIIINAFSTYIAYFLISVGHSKDGSFFNILFSIFGVKGIFISIICGTIVPWFFYLCYKFNIIIRLPKQVPQNISQAFLNIFSLLFVIIVFGVFGFLFAFF